jgi:hypothetical protein
MGCGDFVPQAQQARLSRRTLPNPGARALQDSFVGLWPVGDSRIDGRSQIKLSVAVRVRAWEREKRPGSPG